MAKVLVILADGFEMIEALTPVDILKRAGAQVITAGIGKTFATSTHNVKVSTDSEVSSLVFECFDAVVLPGGMPGAKNLADSEYVDSIVRKHLDCGKLVAAICASPAVVLGAKGLLKGHKAVCYPGMESVCPDVEFSTDKVCVDSNIITARGAGCAMDFALAIAEYLFDKKTAVKVAESIVY